MDWSNFEEDIKRITQVVKSEVGDGDISDKNIKDYKFYEVLHTFSKKILKKTGERFSPTDILKVLKEKDTSIGEKEKERVYGYSLKVAKNLDMELIAQDIYDYAKKHDWSLDVKNVKEFPFYERVASFRKKMGRDISFSEVVNEAIEKLGKKGESIVFEGFRDYKLKREYLAVKQVIEDAKPYIQKDGCLDSLSNSKEGKKILNRMEDVSNQMGLSRIEFVASFFPPSLKTYFSSGMIRIEYINDIESEIKKFVEANGSKNLVSSIREKNPKLFARLRHLAEYFPEGSIPVGGVLDFFGYSGSSKKCLGLKENISDDDVRILIGSIYGDLLTYYKRTSHQVGMQELCVQVKKRMGYSIYRQILRNALKKGLRIEDYINGLQIRPLEEMGCNKLAVMKFDGQYAEPFRYDAGIASRNQLSMKKFDDGKNIADNIRKKLFENLKNTQQDGLSLEEKYKLHREIAIKTCDSLIFEESSENQ